MVTEVMGGEICYDLCDVNKIRISEERSSCEGELHHLSESASEAGNHNLTEIYLCKLFIYINFITGAPQK